MNESDIIEILKLLKGASKNRDWDDVSDAITYLKEYLDNSDDDDEY